MMVRKGPTALEDLVACLVLDLVVDLQWVLKALIIESEVDVDGCALRINL